MHHIQDCLPDLNSDYVPVIDAPYMRRLLDLISDYVSVIDAPYTRLFTGPEDQS